MTKADAATFAFFDLLVAMRRERLAKEAMDANVAADEPPIVDPLKRSADSEM